MPSQRVIAVVGPGDDATEDLCALAYEAGLLLAGGGFVVVNGGLGGVMEAAARGAQEAGGIVIGLLPGDDRAAANAQTVAIPTGLGQARNALVVSAADAVIAVGGSWGTLSEIALARRSGKPVVCLRGWHVIDDGGQRVTLDVADSPEEAVAHLARILTD